MIPNSFKALVSSGEGIGQNAIEVQEVPSSFLHQNEVLIKVTYSALNFKDALSAKGHKGITRSYPHIPGIDAAGIVCLDVSNTFKVGEEVLVTGYDLGMNTPGGFAEYIAIPKHWIHKIPAGLNSKESMILGTAGLTAALALYKCEQLGLKQDQGPVLVTGATGGLGSLSCLLLKTAGYSVSASSGKKKEYDWLKLLGVDEIIERSEFQENSIKPLLPSKFAACIDTIGGITLQNVFKKMNKEAPIAVCGNVAGNDLNTSVLPFIMRGNSLLGIDSAHIDFSLRQELWNRLATNWKIDFNQLKIKEIELSDLPKQIELILQGKQVGKVLVAL